MSIQFKLKYVFIKGNNWGKCDDGVTGAVGCGPQETFRGCADVEIVSHPLLSALSPKSSNIARYILRKKTIIERQILYSNFDMVRTAII